VPTFEKLNAMSEELGDGERLMNFNNISAAVARSEPGKDW
jgi:hypothetical protein